MRQNTTGRAALVISILSLVVTLGGASYAAVKIGTSDIKNNAVTSPKIDNNTVTGKDVKESSLKKVPSASKADTATKAGSATTAGSVNGMKLAKFVNNAVPAAPTPVFSGAGLTLRAACTAGYVRITATTSKNNSSIFSYLADLETDSILGHDFETETFDVGGIYNLSEDATDANTDPALITFEYDALDGSVVAGTLKTDFNCRASGAVMFG